MDDIKPDSYQAGASSAVSPLVDTLMSTDARPAPPSLYVDGDTPPPADNIDLKKYYDRDYAQLEYQKLWSKVWQFVCREEDIPEVGDRYCYDIGPYSWFVVRSAPDRIQAFRNTCLHRGTKLCAANGWSESVRCPFHAWEWNLDGSLKNIPSRWDFKQVKDADYHLPELRVGTWEGYVMVTADPDAPPLEKVLGVLPEHFSSCPPSRHFTAFHLRKKVRANWKTTLEAFLEGYHVIETHTDSMGFTGDASTKYDIWDDGVAHVSRLITPSVVPSPHLGDDASVEDAVNMAFQAFAMATPGVPVPKYDPDSPLPGRAQVAQWRREMMGAALSVDLSELSDAAMVDSIQYYLFPNFCPWYGEGLPLVYQFLPLGDNPDESQMSVRLLAPIPGGGAPCPPSAEIRHLDFDEPFSSAQEIGLLSHIFDQDMSNLPLVQAGLRSAAPDRHYATLGRYQEQRIQHFHRLLDQIIKT